MLAVGGGQAHPGEAGVELGPHRGRDLGIVERAMSGGLEREGEVGSGTGAEPPEVAARIVVEQVVDQVDADQRAENRGGSRQRRAVRAADRLAGDDREVPDAAQVAVDRAFDPFQHLRPGRHLGQAADPRFQLVELQVVVSSNLPSRAWALRRRSRRPSGCCAGHVRRRGSRTLQRRCPRSQSCWRPDGAGRSCLAASPARL